MHQNTCDRHAAYSPRVSQPTLPAEPCVMHAPRERISRTGLSQEKSSSSPIKGRKGLRGSKRKYDAEIISPRPFNTSTTALQDRCDSAHSGPDAGASATSTPWADADGTLYDMAWLTFLVFVVVLFSCAKVLELSAASVEAIAQLSALWIGMMLCLFGLTLINNVVTRKYLLRRGVTHNAAHAPAKQ